MTSRWDRIAVAGSTGAGKSTLARELSERLGSRHTELDSLFFAPGWEPRPKEAFRRDVAAVAAGDRWVIDGNYRPVRDLVWRRATAVVWLDYSLARCFWQALKRTTHRCFTGETICGENQETFRQSFLSSDSVLLWVLRTHAGRRKETKADLALPHYAHLHSEHLLNPKPTEKLLTDLNLTSKEA